MKEITLPVPPSVNAMYRHVGHTVYKTDTAKVWEKDARTLLSTQWKEKPKLGAVTLVIDLCLKTIAGDIDNRLKALLDVMQGKVYENDKQIIHLTIRKLKDAKNPRVIIQVI